MTEAGGSAARSEPTRREHPEDAVAQGRLEDQLGWYDQKSVVAQRAYKRVKVLQLCSVPQAGS